MVDTVTAETPTAVIACMGTHGRRTQRRVALSRGGAGMLRAMDALRRSRRVPMNNRARMAVVAGPGTFGRVRLGVVLTNALAWATGMRTGDGNAHAIVAPEYGKPPSITVPDGERKR